MPQSPTLERIANALERVITPGLTYSQIVFEDRLQTRLRRAESWLDLGCGHRVLPEWRQVAETELAESVPFAVGVDADFDAIRRHRSLRHLCLADIGTLPFRTASFDLVTANMVVEHLDEPAAQFAEVARVLTPGGVFVFHTPNARSYVVAAARLLPEPVKRALARVLEDRPGTDVYATHYRANEKSAIERASVIGGLIVDQIEFLTSSPALRLLPPLLVPELLWIRQLQRRDSLAKYRPVLLCVLRKPA